jgi:hypothetical protein
MKPIVIYSDKFLNRVSIFFKVGGISLFPFIILRENTKQTRFGKRLVNHETIHFKQAIETLIIGFYLMYVLNFLINLVIYRNVIKAYENILFEKEAYGNETNFEYLQNRRLFSWMKYCGKV